MATCGGSRGSLPTLTYVTLERARRHWRSTLKWSAASFVKLSKRSKASRVREFTQLGCLLCTEIISIAGFLLTRVKFDIFTGRPFNPHYTITNSVSNVICCVVFGHRFEYTDPNYRKILELDNEAIVLSGSAQAQVFLM